MFRSAGRKNNLRVGRTFSLHKLKHSPNHCHALTSKPQRPFPNTGADSKFDLTNLFDALLGQPEMSFDIERRQRQAHQLKQTILNCCGVIITTNHKVDGIYLPTDDRRHFVAWSELNKDDFSDDYWNEIWSWYDQGGERHVAAYLADLDLSEFNAKAPPPKTQAFWEIVDANRAPEDAELADAIDALRSPKALTLEQIASRADGSLGEYLRDRRNARKIPHRLEACGYVAVRNDGRWMAGGR
jgi:hypothetical protein